MLNTTMFTLLAGNPEPWDDEIRESCEPGTRSGTFASGNLCRIQAEQSARGRRSAELVHSVHGWTVRAASGLQGFAIMYRSGDHKPADALKWGCDWANAEPDKREFFVRNDAVERSEKLVARLA